MRTKVFALGFSKTGTSSLAQALKDLGYRTVHNPTDDETMVCLLRGDLRCAVLQSYDAVCDIMFVRHFRELDRIYPGSRFVLTERDKSTWHESCAHHWAKRQVTSANIWNEDLVDFQVYGTALYNHDLFDDAYNSHYRAVVEYFKDRPRHLLRMNICAGDGWEPLCNYLGVETPKKPFPHIRPSPWMPPHPMSRSDELPNYTLTVLGSYVNTGSVD